MTLDEGSGFLDFDRARDEADMACGIGSDAFSVRWRRLIELRRGTYRFTVAGNNAVKLFVDDAPIADVSFGPTVAAETVDIRLEAGSHRIRCELSAPEAAAAMALSWEPLSRRRRRICPRRAARERQPCSPGAIIRTTKTDSRSHTWTARASRRELKSVGADLIRRRSPGSRRARGTPSACEPSMHLDPRRWSPWTSGRLSESRAGRAKKGLLAPRNSSQPSLRVFARGVVNEIGGMRPRPSELVTGHHFERWNTVDRPGLRSRTSWTKSHRRKEPPGHDEPRGRRRFLGPRTIGTVRVRSIARAQRTHRRKGHTEGGLLCARCASVTSASTPSYESCALGFRRADWVRRFSWSVEACGALEVLGAGGFALPPPRTLAIMGRMDAERYDRLHALFLSALQAPPEQRAALLDTACERPHAARRARAPAGRLRPVGRLPHAPALPDPDARATEPPPVTPHPLAFGARSQPPPLARRCPRCDAAYPSPSASARATANGSSRTRPRSSARPSTGSTRSRRCLGRAGWARSTAPATACSRTWSRSSCCRARSATTRCGCGGSCAKGKPPGASGTRTRWGSMTFGWRRRAAPIWYWSTLRGTRCARSCGGGGS